MHLAREELYRDGRNAPRQPPITQEHFFVQLFVHSGGRVLFFPYLSMYWILNSTLQVK